MDEKKYMDVSLICYVQIIIIFYKFCYFFCRRHSLMNQACYNNLLQIMQHHNFQNLNRMIFTHWKELESRVNAFWYCFPVIKQYILLSDEIGSIPRNQSSFEILQLFDIWRYQSLLILFLSFVMIFIYDWLE